MPDILGSIRKLKQLIFSDASGDVLTINTGTQTANRVLTMPVLAGDDILTANDAAATLTHKTIPVGGTNLVMGLGDAEFTSLSGVTGVVQTRINAVESGQVTLQGRCTSLETRASNLELADIAIDGRLDVVESIIGGAGTDRALYVSSNTNYSFTTLDAECTVVMTGTAARVVTLPASPLASWRRVIIDGAGTAATANITVNRSGSQTFEDGSTNKTINAAYGVLECEWDSTSAKWVTRISAAPPTDMTRVSEDFAVGTNGVTAGSVVELVSDGVQNLQNIYHCEAPTISSLLTLDGTNDINRIAMCPIDIDSVFCMTRNASTGYVTLREIVTGNPPTATNTLSLGNTDYTAVSCAKLGTNTIAFTYSISDGSDFSTAIATINTTNITLSTAANIANIFADVAATCALTSSNWFVAYAGTNGPAYAKLAVASGTNAPTLSTAGLINGSVNTASAISLCRLTDTTAISIVDYGTNATYLCQVTSAGTNAPTYGTESVLDVTNNCSYITQSPIDSNHTLCAYNNATTSNGCLAVIQANGTNAATMVGRAVFAVSAVTYCTLASHSASLHSLLYVDSNSAGQHLAVSVDTNYVITWSKQSTLNGTTNCAYNAITALTATTAIGAWEELAGGDGKAATLTLTPTPTISGQLIGISQDTATNGTATIDLGPVWDTTNTLTLGEEYFASGAGGLTTNATPVFVGTADSTTSLVLDLSGNPSVGLEQVWEITTAGAFSWTAPESGEYEIVFCGGGGSGAQAASVIKPAGNGGNTIIISKTLSKFAIITGTIGTGGAGQNSGNTAGNNGGNTTVTVAGSTYIAKGGKGGIKHASTACHVNSDNDSYAYNILGTCGKFTPSDSAEMQTGGVPQLIGANPMLAAGDATRGGGTWGLTNTGTTGKGGNGVLRITLRRGT